MPKSMAKPSPTERISNLVLSDLVNLGNDVLDEPSVAERRTHNVENGPIIRDDISSTSSDSWHTTQNAAAAAHNNRMETRRGRRNINNDISVEEELVVETVLQEEEESADEDAEFHDPPIRVFE